MAISVFPIEETIMDPLYEPMKLNRYELCSHLTMLSNVSHLNYGFSPYLLFDVGRWNTVVGIIEKTECDEKINEILKYKDFLGMVKSYIEKLTELQTKVNTDKNEHLGVLKRERDCIKQEYKQIKTEYNKMLHVFLYKYLFSIDAGGLEETSESNVILEKLKKEFKKREYSFSGEFTISESESGVNEWLISNKFKVIKKDGKLSIYLLEPNVDSDKFRKNFNRIVHLFQLDYPVNVECPACPEDQFMCEEGKIYSMKESLLRSFELRRAKWLQMSGSLHTVHRSSTHTRLSHQIGSMIVGINGLREIDVYPRGNMSMMLGEYLTLTGDLHEFLMANFLHDIGHSPLSHVLEPNPFVELDHETITTNLVCGAKVETGEKDSMDWHIAECYLLKTKAIKAFEHKFLNKKYDPMYNTNEIYLFAWDKIPGDRDENKKLIKYLKKIFEKMEWLKAEYIEKNDDDKIIKISHDGKQILLKLADDKINLETNDDGTYEFIAKMEYGELNIYDEKKESSEEDRKANFLHYLKINEEILESDIVTVSNVLNNCGVDNDRIVELLSGKLFCSNKECKKLLAIDGHNMRFCSDATCKKECGDEFDTMKSCMNQEAKIEKEKIYNTVFLNKLIESEIDFDRIDHVKRDSVVCGLSLANFKLLELLGSMSIVLPDSAAYMDIHDSGSDKPYILISEDGIIYVMNLLTARKCVFNDILYSDENNWINGVVNQITAMAVYHFPHIKNMLPFVTDQILMHFYTNDLFLGTQIEKFNKLFHGKMEYTGYGEPMRYKLKHGVIVTTSDLKDIYKAVEVINNKPEYEKMELPAVVFYTNIKGTRCPVCGARELIISEKYPGIYACMNCKSHVKTYYASAKDDRWEITNKEPDNILQNKLKEKDNKMYFWNKDYYIKVVQTDNNENGVAIYTGEPKPNREKWDDIFVNGKKYNGKYHQFQKLADEGYEKITNERFPDRPSELDVKNLLYFWINDFVISDKFEGEIKAEIGGIFADNHMNPEMGNGNLSIYSFCKRFVDLNALGKGNEDE